MTAIGTPLVLLAMVAGQVRPAPKLPVGKETTHVTGPIDKDGYVDFEAALNDRMARAVAPEKNANVLPWKALGPTPEGGIHMPPEFFKRLGIDEPPAAGDYFVGMDSYSRDHLKLDPDQRNACNDQQTQAARRVWAAKDYPHVAAWLKANE